MRTNIVIDDDLMSEALAESGARTKREVVEMALRDLVRRRKGLRAQARLRELRGVGWVGDLEAMRLD